MNTVHSISMSLTQVPCSVTPTFSHGSKQPALLDCIFAEYLFLCLIDAHGKTSLQEFHQVPLDPEKLSYSKLSVKMTHMITH